MAECSICVNTFTYFPYVTSACRHVHQQDVCRPCIIKHIKEEANGKGRVGADIVCPSADCKSPFELEDIQRFFPSDPDFVAQYDRRLLMKLIEQDPSFQYCPNQRCGNGQITEDAQDSIFWTCASCKTRVCLSHKVVFHDGQTCREYDGAREANPGVNSEELVLQELERLGGKRCPNCRGGLEKNGGCDHFTCACKAEFCWRCMAPFGPIREEGNHRHRETCRHYSPWVGHGGNESRTNDDDDDEGYDDDDDDVYDDDDE